MNVKGFHYKPLGILGMLEYNVSDVTTSGTDEGTIIATVHIENIQSLPEASEVIVPVWGYPYQFNIHITREFLRKSRTRCLVGITSTGTVSVDFMPY